MTYEKSGLFFVETEKKPLTFNTELLGLAYTCGSFTIKNIKRGSPNGQTESLNLKFKELEITQ